MTTTPEAISEDELSIHLFAPDNCDHQWDGPEIFDEDGRFGSKTCSKCGIDAMSHSIHTADD